jgi:hypothetical protein
MLRGFAPVGRWQDPAPARGSVLLETALAIPMLMAVAVALMWGIGLATTALALGDAARTAARAAARGEAWSEVVVRAEGSVPGARIRTEDSADGVRVVMEKQVSAPVPILSGIDVTLTQSVTIPREWS